MPSFSHCDIVAYYIEEGSGDPVILLHAGGSSGRQWRKVISRLAGRFRCIAPDLIGFGETGGGPTSCHPTHRDQAELARALIEVTCAGQAHVIGHSYGGATAMQLWLVAPERVRSLVFIEPILLPLLKDAGEDALFSESLEASKEFIKLAAAGREGEAWRRFLELRNGVGAWERLSDDGRQRFLDQTEQGINAFKANQNNPVALRDCHQISVSTTVICGGDTMAPDRRITEIMKDVIPVCAHEVIAGAGHMSPSTHPDVVADLIAGHLARASN